MKNEERRTGKEVRWCGGWVVRWLASRRALRGNVHLDNFSRVEQVETWRTGRMVILAAKGTKDAKDKKRIFPTRRKRRGGDAEKKGRE